MKVNAKGVLVPHTSITDATDHSSNNNNNNVSWHNFSRLEKSQQMHSTGSKEELFLHINISQMTKQLQLFLRCSLYVIFCNE